MSGLRRGFPCYLSLKVPFGANLQLHGQFAESIDNFRILHGDGACPVARHTGACYQRSVPSPLGPVNESRCKYREVNARTRAHIPKTETEC